MKELALYYIYLFLNTLQYVTVYFKGDNGSPLVVTVGKTYSLVGIASFISNNGCESTDPSGYTKTHPYWDWVRSITHPDE